MKRYKGFTLIEVIFSITLIGLIAVIFLPMITFGFKNIKETGKFIDILFQDQTDIEKEIENLRDIDPNDRDADHIDTIEIFDQDVNIHKISISNDPSSKINMFLPKRTLNEIVPIIKSPPVIEVRENSSKISPTPDYIDLYKENISLFVNEIDITPETGDYYLMSVYRWYISTEMDKSETPGNRANEYLIIKEWNEARKQLLFENSSNFKFIPNIKDKYNTIILKEIKDKLSLTDEDFINTFGNRYIRYGVTPFSLRGRIGKEEMSNLIYVEAPKIELSSAIFKDQYEIILTFNEEISDVIDIGNIKLNETLGIPKSVYRNTLNYKQLIMEFDHLDRSENIVGNKLLKGAVQSKQYGKIAIWHNNANEGEFTISDAPPEPVTGVSITGGDKTFIVGETYSLTATVNPEDAANKTINWTSSDSSKVSVNENGLISGVAKGTATIRATSASNPTVYAEVTISVLSEEEWLQNILAGITLTVNSASSTDYSSSPPKISIPTDTNGITYAFVYTSNTSYIDINGAGENVTIKTRPGIFSSTASVTIRLRAIKNTQSERDFTVSIPRSGDVTVR